MGDWTKGPWNTYSEEGDQNGIFKHSVCKYVDLMDDDHICVAEARGDSRQRAYDNARLIAAAPELYDALLLARGHVADLLAEFGPKGTPYAEDLAKIDSALRKAGDSNA